MADYKYDSPYSGSCSLTREQFLFHETRIVAKLLIDEGIDTVSASEKVKLTKKLNTLKEQDDEIHSYEEKIHHLADQMISIDLDDGVKHNYALFRDVLAKIK